MHNHLLRRLWLAGWIMLLLLLAGCFQPAGAGLEATSVAQALPTFTPIPTDTPTPEAFPTEPPTPTLQILVVGTQVADAGGQELDPIWQTATAIYLIQQGQEVIPIDPIDQGQGQIDPGIQQIDPLLQTATAMVAQATEAAARPMTETAAAIFGPSATPFPEFPVATWTTSAPVPPVLSGADCVYQVQPDDANLYRISLKFGLPYMSIAQASRLVNPNLIHLWDTLIIPGCGTTGYFPPATLTPSPPFSGGVTAVPGGNCNRGQYTVIQNDTLFALSLTWGTTVNAIASCNAIQNVNLIYIGQTLNIP